MCRAPSSFRLVKKKKYWQSTKEELLLLFSRWIYRHTHGHTPACLPLHPSELAFSNNLCKSTGGKRDLSASTRALHPSHHRQCPTLKRETLFIPSSVPLPVF